jgi:hypothetical protein
MFVCACFPLHSHQQAHANELMATLFWGCIHLHMHLPARSEELVEALGKRELQPVSGRGFQDQSPA